MKTSTVRDATEMKSFLGTEGGRGPSLNPNVRSENVMHRWNGWNYTVAVGVDRTGIPIHVEVWHFAAGDEDYAVASPANKTAHLGTDFTGLDYPVEMLPPKFLNLHPEWTP